MLPCRVVRSSRVAGDEVAGARREDDERAVVVDLGLERLGVADDAAVAFLLTRIVVLVWRSRRKMSALAVGVAGDEVGGRAGERDVAAVAADGRLDRVAVARAGAGEVDADQLGGEELAAFERLDVGLQELARRQRDPGCGGHGR